MDLYKLFLKFYRTKPIKGPYQPVYSDYVKNMKLFTYDIVADPGFSGTPGNIGTLGNIGLKGNIGYSEYISTQLKDSKSYSEYLTEEMKKLPEQAQTPELALIFTEILNSL